MDIYKITTQNPESVCKGYYITATAENKQQADSIIEKYKKSGVFKNGIRLIKYVIPKQKGFFADLFGSKQKIVYHIMTKP